MDPPPSMSRVAVVGGGPAGLMAAEVARGAGFRVDVFEARGSVGRKFLIAGKGGLNLTHSEPRERFGQRYAQRQAEVAPWLDGFDADALRAWARDLGVETFVGTSGRVFPTDMKAAPLLRGWVRRLREQGVRFHMHSRWSGWDEDGALRFSTPDGERLERADAVVLALGGGSYAKLGSDGEWVTTLTAGGIDVAPLRPSNCGFDVEWSEVLSRKFAGQPVKPVVATYSRGDGTRASLQGEFIVTATGVEGSLIYALSAILREEIDTCGYAILELDLVPNRDRQRLEQDLARPQGRQSFAKHFKRSAGIEGVKAALLREYLPADQFGDPVRVAAALKALPIRLVRPRPIDEAISTAGGVVFTALDARLMLRTRPGTFVAGEMIDWEAPTGGYLLTACFASGFAAGQAAVDWLRTQAPSPSS